MVKAREVNPFVPSLIPKTLRILGKDYPVKVRVIKGGAWGQFKGPEQCIELSSKFSSMDEAVDTLLHEAIHAIEYNQGLDYDEARVRATATGLLAIFRDNPSLLKLIQGDYSVRRKPKPSSNP